MTKLNYKSLLSFIQLSFSDGKSIASRMIEIIDMDNEEFLEEFENKIIHDFGCIIWGDVNSIAYYKMLIFNKMLQYYSVEGDGDKYIWLNSGDIYNTTLCYSNEKYIFFISAPGDLDIDESL